MRTTVLYFHTGSSSFVDKDIEILQRIGTVVPFSFTSKSKAGTPLLLFLQLGFLLRHLFSSRLFVAQFAGYHTFLPAVISRLTGKRLLIISGGTDCHSFPGIGYGNFQKQVLRIFTGWSFRLCNHIAPKHESLWFSEYTYDNSEPSHQGIKAFLPKLSTPHTSIPNGYDPDKWKPVPSVLRQPRSFLTVSGGFHFPFQQALKGIDLVLQIARRFPDCTFTVIGVDDPSVFKNPPPNVLLLPKADDAVLLKAYCSHTFYLQLSMAEGFPNALCESMLCGCVPIGSAVFSIPEIIGENGYLLRHRDMDELEKLLRQAMNEDESKKGDKARNSILERFPLSKRKTALIALCRRLVP